MVCYYPLKAFQLRPDGEAKGRILFKRSPSRAFRNAVALDLPCGRCCGCRLERSRQWAMRCLHEKRLHMDSVFITLTYNDEYLPPGGTLVKRDFQLFMKRLRKEKGEGVRFYACGEYGEKNGRPHYHALLFNCDFPDKVRHSQNGRGEVWYTSKSLAVLWPYGFNIVGDVTFDSAAYVARYVMKKVNGALAEEHYCVMDGNGVCYDRLPEFTVMSRRPGIGSGYYDKYGGEVRDHDNVIVNGRPVRPPRFYDTRTELVDAVRLLDIKKERRRKALEFASDNTPDRRRVREIVQLKRLENLKRSV